MGGMIPRLIEKIIFDRLYSSKKIVIILGARQVGKTTLLRSLGNRLHGENKKILYLNCDIEEDCSSINTTSLTVLKKLTAGLDYVFIDEAQRLSNPGLTLKIVHDNIPSVKIVATGSSSFELKNKLSDALTGRYFDYTLYPLSLMEMLANVPSSNNQVLLKKQADTMLEDILLYGLYPEIYLIKRNDERKILLEKIVESYLFKDILAFQKVRYPQAIRDLTCALAYQIGAEVNENELANRIKIDRKTVVNYLDILEQAFVIIRVFPYSKNPRREIGKKYKIYFTDVGIRNALIGDFNSTNVRANFGSLWENFLIVERLKMYANKGQLPKINFWRSYGGAEVDYLERFSLQERFKAFEIKHTQVVSSKGAKLFSKEYGVPIRVINKDNYLDFVA